MHTSTYHKLLCHLDTATFLLDLATNAFVQMYFTDDCANQTDGNMKGGLDYSHFLVLSVLNVRIYKLSKSSCTLILIRARNVYTFNFNFQSVPCS